MTIGSENTRITTSTRLFALIAALVLAFSVGTLTGCGDNSSTASSSTATASQSASTSSSSDAAQIAVTVSIDTTAAEGDVKNIEVKLDSDASVLDALETTELTLDVQDSSYGKYVNAIDGLAAGDKGDQSGWMYSVNGEMGAVSAGEQTVADGDTVTWQYVTSFE